MSESVVFELQPLNVHVRVVLFEEVATHHLLRVALRLWHWGLHMHRHRLQTALKRYAVLRAHDIVERGPLEEATFFRRLR